MAPINGRDELLAALAPSACWRVADLRMTLPDTPGPWRHVIAWTLGDTSEHALEGARRVWALVDGRKRYLRVTPDAFMHGTQHAGYVRFAFCNEPGDEVYARDLEPGFAYPDLRKAAA